MTVLMTAGRCRVRSHDLNGPAGSYASATLGTQVNFSTAFPHIPLPTPFTPNTRTRTTPMAGTFDPNQAQNLVEVP